MFFFVTRFSVFDPSSPQWHLSKNVNTQSDYQLYKKILFEENRLNIRMHILKDLSLPLLDKMSKKHHIIHVIHYSNSLPEQYKKQLIELASNYDFIRILETDYENQGVKNSSVNAIMERELLKIAKYDDELYFGYAMLDDDDLLSIDFCDRMCQYIRSSFFGMWISFGKGITGYYDINNKKLSNIRESYFPKINIGFMGICQFNVEKNIIKFPKNGDHMKKDIYAPIVIDSRDVSYLWIRHNFQDTLEIHQDFEMKKLKINDNLNYFPLFVNEGELLSKFPTIQFEQAQFGLQQELVKDNVIITKIIKRFGVNPVFGTINISYEINCDSVNSDKPALICFKFNLEHQDLKKLFGVSGNPDIGYYRYLPLTNGCNKANIIFTLPEGIAVTGIGIRQWGQVSKIDLYHLEISRQLG